MQIDRRRRYGAARTATVAILAGLVGGCAGQSMPAPVYLRGASEPFAAPMPMAMPAPPLQVVVKRGQTLDGYAYTYHLPKSAIIAANGLRPPYELKAGQHLMIPNARGPVQQAMASPPGPAAHPWSPPPAASVQQAAIPQPPRTAQTIATPAPSSQPPQTIFAAPAQPTAPAAPTPPPAPRSAAAAPAAPQQPATPPASTAKYLPEIIPLDGPPPAKEAEAAPPKPAALTPPQPSVPSPAVVPLNNPPPAAAGAPPAAQADAASAPGGRFPWPVRGRVLATYGSSPGGGHNDGINIAAPLGTPVRAIDSGTVVYAGNEVKGYGNIVLIRHANGWISAYAHLDDVGVKPGDAISSGEVIAKVGSSGGVTQPQLHFELRRGKKSVNPTEFLAPAPSAAAPGTGGAG